MKQSNQDCQSCVAMRTALNSGLATMNTSLMQHFVHVGILMLLLYALVE